MLWALLWYMCLKYHKRKAVAFINNSLNHILVQDKVWNSLINIHQKYWRDTRTLNSEEIEALVKSWGIRTLYTPTISNTCQIQILSSHKNYTNNFRFNKSFTWLDGIVFWQYILLCRLDFVQSLISCKQISIFVRWYNTDMYF